MKPIARKAFHSSSFVNGNFNANFGSKNTVASIKGSVKKLGIKYSQALVVLYSKADLLPVAIRKPDTNGNYQVLGLNVDITCFIVALDKRQQYNAVIQDMVVPK